MGDYTFEVTITNASGMSITSDVDVTVGQIPAELSITPGTATVAAGDTQEFDFSGTDQFGAALDEPALDWTATDSAGDNAVSGDDGTIDSFGFYTAPTDNAGAITITAKGPSSASASASASVNVPVTTPDLTATEASDGTHIDLNWDFDDTALNNAAGFDLERKATGESTYTVIATITDATATAFTDTAVSNGTTYDYRLKPYVHIGGLKVFGTAAGPASVTMVGMINSTSADDPVLVNSGGMATISLPFSDSNASATHTATIDWGDGTTSSPDVTTASVTEASGSTSATISASKTGLADGTYDATATITNSDGTVTPIPVEIEVGGIPSAPTGASASVTGGNVTVSWSAPSSGYTPTVYTIYGSTDSGTTWTAIDEVDSGQTSDSVSGLTPSTASHTVHYEFEVSATNDFGESGKDKAINSDGTPLQIISPFAPATPTDVSATLAAGDVRLGWTVTDALATAFNIYESTDGETTFSYFDSVTPDSSGSLPTTYTATGLTAETTPKFYVTAQDAGGESLASSHVGVAVPSPVGGVTVSLNSTDTTATIHWTAVSGAIGYYVDRIPDDGSTPTLLPEVTPGSTNHTTDTGLDPTQSYQWKVNAVYPVSSAMDGSGSGGGSGGSGGTDGSDGSTGSGGSTDGSGGSSTGTGTDSGSDPADDASQDIAGFTATVNANNTVTLNWSYQGSATFEIEEQDPTQAGTNFYFVQSTTGRTVTLGGFAPGNQYPIRIRADRADGTASDYVSALASIPSSDDSGSGDDDDDITPPGVSLNNLDSNNMFEDDTWNATLNVTPPDDSSDTVSAGGVTRVGDKYGIIDDGYQGDFGPCPPYKNAPILVGGTPGATYEFNFYTHSGSEVSAPGQLKITMPGSTPSKLTLQAAKPSSSGAVTFTWTPPDISQYDGWNSSGWYGDPSDPLDANGTVSFYERKTVDGKDTATLLPASAALSPGTVTMTLSPGVHHVFAVYDVYTDAGDVGYSPYSSEVDVTVTPQAVSPRKVWLDQKSKYGIEVNWVNTSSYESGFDVQRSVDGGAWQTIHHCPLDACSYTDDVSALAKQFVGEIQYRIIADSEFTSPDAPTAPVTFTPAYAGADTTQNLAAIATAFKTQLAPLGSLGGLYLESCALSWDIDSLLANPTPPGSQPNAVAGTCTVSGKVYHCYAANYWLAGLMSTGMGTAGAAFWSVLVPNWAMVKLATNGDDPREKYVWYQAGMAVNPAGTSASAALSDIWPGKPTNRLLSWHVGSRLGGAN